MKLGDETVVLREQHNRVSKLSMGDVVKCTIATLLIALSSRQTSRARARARVRVLN